MPRNWRSADDPASAVLTKLDRRARLLAVCLSAVAGYVDAVGFLHSGGYFVSFMSGNSTRLAVGVAQAGSSAGIAAGLICCFVFGVVLGSICGSLFGARRSPLVLLLLGALLAAAAVLDTIGARTVAVGVSALAMGAVNAVFERPDGGSVGLTYMTGALVRAGQGIAAMLLGGGSLEWLSYLALWAGLVVGGIAGATLYATFGAAALWFPAILSLALAALVSRGARLRSSRS